MFADLHQELDRLSKSGDGLAGFFEGPNVFYAALAVPLHLPNDAYKTGLVTCCWLGWQQVKPLPSVVLPRAGWMIHVIRCLGRKLSMCGHTRVVKHDDDIVGGYVYV